MYRLSTILGAGCAFLLSSCSSELTSATTTPEINDDLPPAVAEQKPEEALPSMAAVMLIETIQRIDPDAVISGPSASFTVEDIPVTLVYDLNANRMRLVAPITPVGNLGNDDLTLMMQANFDTALDARYAIAQNAVWATFIHPLSSLTQEDFVSGIGQTVNLVLSYGTTYSSGVLVFGGGDNADRQQRLIEELQKKSAPI